MKKISFFLATLSLLAPPIMMQAQTAGYTGTGMQATSPSSMMTTNSNATNTSGVATTTSTSTVTMSTTTATSTTTNGMVMGNFSMSDADLQQLAQLLSALQNFLSMIAQKIQTRAL